MKKSLLYRIIRKVFGIARVEYCRDRMWRSYMDLGRRRVWVLTPIDAVLRLLAIKNLLPSPLIALEVFGRQGLWKTVDYAHRCEYLEHYEIEPDHARYAAKALPSAVVVAADSVHAVKTGSVRRHDYSMVVIDGGTTVFGNGYAEHFDFFPAIFAHLAKRSVIVTNLFLDVPEATPELLERRRKFYGVDARSISYADAEKAYRGKVPTDFKLLDIFPVPHPGRTVFVVMVVERVSNSATIP